jgi:hypothetical protein
MTIYERTAKILGVEKGKETPTLPQLVLDVRMSVNGAADPWPSDALQSVQSLFKMRLEEWQQTRDTIDAAIWIMVAEALRLIETELAGRHDWPTHTAEQPAPQ